MQNHSLPLLFFAFANDKTRLLHAIPKEFNELDNLLLTKKQLCEAQFKPNISAYDFHHVISALGKDIYIIHYGGHTDGYQTVFTDENQDASPFHGSGFVEMIKALPHLQLIFINGCNSAQMVNELYDAGVPAVIGTTHNVQDTVAYELSVAFYKGLANQNTITAAWTQAAAFIKGQYKNDIRFRGVSFDDEDIDRDNPHAAWFIKLHEGAGDWKLSEIKKHSFPPLHNAKDFSLAHPTIGRDKDLTAVCDMLAEQQQCIVVNGIGGIGKSTLVKYYIQQYKAQYQHIIWLQEKETAVNILLDDSIFLTHLGIYEQVLAFKNASNPEAALELTISKLNELPKQTLLVADNVSDLNGFEIICNALDKDIFHILATSRKQTGNFAFHELDHLSLPDAKDLFVSHCKQKTKGNPHAQKALLENPTLERILAKIDYHTLTIEIIAKIYNNSKTLTLESLEQKLQEAILNPKLPQTAYTHYTQKETTILATILAAFDIGGLSQQTAALDILAQWAVLPATPIPLEHLIALFGIHTENEDDFDAALTFLTDNAWIQQDKATENSYACHALIQEAVRWQLKEDENGVEKPVRSQRPDGFLYNIINNIKKSFGFNSTKSVRFQKTDGFDYTLLIERLYWLLKVEAGDNPLEKAIWLPYAANILSHLIAETEALATLFNNTAFIYENIGNLPKSLEYGLKSMVIREKIFFPEHPSLATSYNNIAGTYKAMGDLPKSLEYGLKSMAIWEKVLSLEHPDLATSYNNIAAIYETMGDLPKSLAYGLKSMAIWEKFLSPEHPNLATSYNNIAAIYKAMVNLPKALEYGLKDIAICEKILSPEHPWLATSYNNIAKTYEAMGDLPKSLEYGLKSMAIREKVLSPEHPDLAQSYNNIAHTYYHLQDYLQSLAYFQKAIPILKKSLPKGHLHIKKAIDWMAVVLQAAIKAGQGEAVAEYKKWYEEEGKVEG